MASFITLFFILVFFHFLADYPLQGDFLARAKNHNNPVDHVPWYHAMFAHSFIHAGFVYLATGMPLLFVAELTAHFVTDHYKCRGELTYAQDQYFHLTHKFIWALIVVLTP